MMSIFSAAILSTLLCISAPEAHLSPFDAPMAPGEPSGLQSIGLTTARDEYEHFYVRIVNDSDSRSLKACEANWKDASTVIATTRLIVPTPAPIGGPDKPGETLVPFDESVTLAAGATVDFLISVHTKAEAQEGILPGELRIEFDAGKSIRCAIRLEVLSFSLPPTPSLPVLFGLNVDQIADEAGLAASLDEWAPIYDTLASMRAGYSVWPHQKPKQEIFYDYSDLDLVKEHLTYAIRTAILPAVEIGGPAGALLANWPPPVGNAPQDPLQLLLANLTSHLQQLGWSNPTVLIPTAFTERDGWPELRQALARTERADRKITRLLPAPLHPYFERYTDAWALPALTSPTAMILLERGFSIIRYAHPAYSRVEGSPGSMELSGTYQTNASDAVDGCEYTAWRCSEDTPGTSQLDLTLEFADVLHLEQMAVIWPQGISPSNISVKTAFNSGSFSDATVRWETSTLMTEAEQVISLGDFRYPRDCREIQIQFQSPNGGRLAVAEILFNQDARTVVNAAIDPVAPWLNLRTLPAVYLDPDDRPDTARLLGWFCWQRNFRGILGPELGTPEGALTARLITVIPQGVQPTLRMLHLLDGLEDYEYLKRYRQALLEDAVTPPEDFRPGWGTLPTSGRNAVGRDAALLNAREERRKMGQLLSGHPLVTKNFGP